MWGGTTVKCGLFTTEGKLLEDVGDPYQNGERRSCHPSGCGPDGEG